MYIHKNEPDAVRRLINVIIGRESFLFLFLNAASILIIGRNNEIDIRAHAKYFI